jgi:hypothetical protein
MLHDYASQLRIADFLRLKPPACTPFESQRAATSIPAMRHTSNV